MSTAVIKTPNFYPESDGKPMADNTIQFRWIQDLSQNLRAVFRGRDDVFVGGNLFWYPLDRVFDIVQAPDVFVVFGRPPGERSVYAQAEEGDVPMTVVFEIRAPNDNDELMLGKLEFYDEYEADEYYMYDPERNRFEAYVRRGGGLAPQRLTQGRFTSPRLGIHFQIATPELLVFYPDGTPFVSFVEMKTRAEREQANREAAQRERDAAQRERDAAQREREAAQRERDAAQRERDAAQREREAAQKHAEQERLQKETAQQLADQERQDKEAAQRALEAAQQQAEQMAQQAARLRELSRKAVRGTASADELEELARLTQSGD